MSGQPVVDRLQVIVDAMPPGSAVVLPIETLRGWLGDNPTVTPTVSATVDLTASDAAMALGRAASTVRGWCAEGMLPGAYRLCGREWRIPPSALHAFMRNEQRAAYQPDSGVSGKVPQLGDWRRVAPSATEL